MRTLERRLEALEAASGGDGGCDRCRGVLAVVSDVLTGEIHSARWNGEALSEDELAERRQETRCPKCGRGLDSDEYPVIKVGGLQRS